MLNEDTQKKLEKVKLIDKKIQNRRRILVKDYEKLSKEDKKKWKYSENFSYYIRNYQK